MARGGYPLVGVHRQLILVASHCRAPILGAWASVVAAHGPSSCGIWAQLLHGMWNPPRPGIETLSPTLAGGFLSTVPLGSSCVLNLNIKPNLTLSLNIKCYEFALIFLVGVFCCLRSWVYYYNLTKLFHLKISGISLFLLLQN